MSKSLSQFNDHQKTSENIKTPLILCISEEKEKSQSIIVFFQTYGRLKAHNICESSVTLEEYDWKSISVKSYVTRISTNGFAGIKIKLHPGKAYKFSFDCNTSYCLNLFSREEFFFEDEAKYLLERQGVKCREFEDISPAQQQGSCIILFK
jgi:uncharacterized protein affecting Mg2+/Co2+ transport